MSDSDSDDDIPTLLDIDSPSSAVPVTILTGFLGSGKTTLLKNILTSKQHNRRIAVIENEFGEGSIGNNGVSSSLSVETIIAKDGTDNSSLSDLIELPNGCVCCTVKDSLVLTLERLLDKKANSLDYIIIECSGMADPGPVASVFWLDEALGSRLRLDGIVGVVDVVNVLGQLESTSSSSLLSSTNVGEEVERGGGDEAARQIAFADRILVNKIDLLESRQEEESGDRSTTIQKVLDAINAINPTAPTILTTFSSMDDIHWVLDTQCFNPERIKEVEDAYESLMRGQCGDVKCMCSQQYCGICNDASTFAAPSSLSSPPTTASTTLQHRHTSAISTIALFNIGSVDLHKLNSWLASILWPNQDEKDSVLKARLQQSNVEDSKKIDKATSNRNQQIYRIKGVISVQHSTLDDWNDTDPDSINKYIDVTNNLDQRRYIVQAVNDLWDVTPASDGLCWKDGETRCCKIVVIGKWLDDGSLRKEFEACFCS
jgi:G3E family GTPase